MKLFFKLFLLTIVAIEILSAKNIDLTNQEMQWIKNNPTIKVHNESNWPPYNYSQNGKPLGYSIDIMNLITQKTGLTVKYVTGPTWNDFLGMMKEKTLDVMLNIVKTPEREKYLLYTPPYADNPNAIISKKNTPYDSIESLYGKTVALPKGFFHEEILKEKYPQIKLLPVKNLLESMKAVTFGKADAALGELAVINYLLSEHMMTDLAVSGEAMMGDPEFSLLNIATRKDLPILQSILSKGVNSLTVEEKRDLQNKWLGKTQPKKVSLSEEEKEFLKTNPIIKVHNELDWPPYNYSQNGKPMGYSIDIMNLIAKKTGISVEFVTGPSWDQFLEKMQNKTLDVMLNIVKTPEREKYLLYTPPYADNPNVIISKQSTPYEDIESLFGKTVAVPKGFFTQEAMKVNYPQVKLLLVKNTLESMKAVIFGKADAALGELAVFNHLSTEHMLSNLIVSGEAKMGDPEYSLLNIATRKDLPVLQSILSKGVQSLTINEKRELQQKWLGAILEKQAQIRLTQKEQKWLNEHRVIKVSNELDYPPFDFAINKQPMGYSIDLLNLLADKTGLNVEYVNGYSWAQLVEKFKKRELDLLHTLSITPERKKFGLYSDSYSRSKSHFITRIGEESITSIEQLFGKTMAVGKGWRIEEFVETNYPQINLLRVDSLEEMLLAVSTGRADATADNNAVAKYVMKTKRINDLQVGSWFKEMDQGDPVSFHFMAQKESPELISILNKAMATLSIEELEELEKKWFGSSSNDKQKNEITIDLDQEEKSYLNQKNRLNICVDPDWLPFEKIDEEGKYKGIGSDIINIVSEKINKPINLVKTTSWSETLESFKNKKCDIVPMVVETTNRKKIMNFTKPYLKKSLVVATKEDQFFIQDSSELIGKKIGLVKGYAFIDLLKEKHPDINIITVKDIEEGLKKVHSGKLYGFVDTLPSIGYIIQKEAMLDLKIAGRLEFDAELRIASQKDEPLLNSIMQKALDDIPNEQINSIVGKWISIKIEQSFDYRILIYTVVGFLIILIMLMFRQNYIKKMNKKLEQISITDALTNIYNRRHFNELFPKYINSAKRKNELVSFIIMDIDHFKQYNDTYGHQMGDDALVKVAQTIKASLHRSDDYCFRVGGEEFAVIFKSDGEEKALEFANSIKENIESLHIKHNSNSASSYVTVSMGLICKHAHEINSDDEVYKQADDLLYKAKECGRNKVVSELL